MKCPCCRRRFAPDYEVCIEGLGKDWLFAMCFECAMAVLSVLEGTRQRREVHETQGATGRFKSIAEALAEVGADRQLEAAR